MRSSSSCTLSASTTARGRRSREPPSPPPRSLARPPLYHASERAFNARRGLLPSAPSQPRARRCRLALSLLPCLSRSLYLSLSCTRDTDISLSNFESPLCALVLSYQVCGPPGSVVVVAGLGEVHQQHQPATSLFSSRSLTHRVCLPHPPRLTHTHTLTRGPYLMFRNVFHTGIVSVFYAQGTEPLGLWDTHRTSLSLSRTNAPAPTLACSIVQRAARAVAASLWYATIASARRCSRCAGATSPRPTCHARRRTSRARSLSSSRSSACSSNPCVVSRSMRLLSLALALDSQ